MQIERLPKWNNPQTFYWTCNFFGDTTQIAPTNDVAWWGRRQRSKIPVVQSKVMEESLMFLGNYQGIFFGEHFFGDEYDAMKIWLTCENNECNVTWVESNSRSYLVPSSQWFYQFKCKGEGGNVWFHHKTKKVDASQFAARSWTVQSVSGSQNRFKL